MTEQQAAYMIDLLERILFVLGEVRDKPNPIQPISVLPKPDPVLGWRST